jgi:hypothetical protein
MHTVNNHLINTNFDLSDYLQYSKFNLSKINYTTNSIADTERTISKYSIKKVNESNANNCLYDDPESIEFLLALTNRILQVYPWIILVIGTLSNILSFVVFTRAKLRKSLEKNLKF